MLVSSSESLPLTSLEQESDGNSSRRPRTQHEAAAPTRRKVKEPPMEGKIDGAPACKALLSLGVVVMMLVLGNISHVPEAMITVERLRTWGNNHSLKTAHHVAKVVAKTVTETMLEYVTASPTSLATVSTLASGLTTAANAMPTDTTTMPNYEDAMVFWAVKYVAISFTFLMLAVMILLLVGGLGSSITKSCTSNKVSPIEPMEQPVVDPTEVSVETGGREHTLAGIWAREEREVAEREHLRRRDLKEETRRRWEMGRADRRCRETIERMRPPPSYEEAMRSAGIVLDYARAFEAQGRETYAFEPAHGGGSGVQWLNGTARRPRP